MSWLRRIFPFNTEQTVNILSEFGPLMTMFIVNAVAGIAAGTWSLLISTVIAMVTMRVVLGRLPIFPLIASSVTVCFGSLTLITDDPMWVQIKVSIFNALFGGFLFGGLFASGGLFRKESLLTVMALTAVAVAAQMVFKIPPGLLDGDFTALMSGQYLTNIVCLGSMVIGFGLGALTLKKNFFKYVFDKTFQFSQEGWDRFTYSFAWFFVFTAIANEAVRLYFEDGITVFDHYLEGVQVWILFKVCIIMPLSGIYAWYLTRLMHKYRLPDPEPEAAPATLSPPVHRKDAAEFAAISNLQTPLVARSTSPKLG